MEPLAFRKGKYIARLTRDAADIRAAQRLRYQVFFDPTGDDSAGNGLDIDGFDALCDHVLIENADTGALVSCFRVMGLTSGQKIQQSYSAQFYDLSALEIYPHGMIEMGRFCVDSSQRDPEILRMAWAMMTRLVDGHGFEMMFGCSSFAGTDAHAYAHGFSLLDQSYIAPENWRPLVKAPEFSPLKGLLTQDMDKRRAMRDLPSLLRTYLAMGGRVSDHAVIDRALNTLHVFTGLEVANVPPARAKALRALAKS